MAVPSEESSDRQQGQEAHRRREQDGHVRAGDPYDTPQVGRIYHREDGRRQR